MCRFEMNKNEDLIMIASSKNRITIKRKRKEKKEDEVRREEIIGVKYI